MYSQSHLSTAIQEHCDDRRPLHPHLVSLLRHLRLQLDLAGLQQQHRGGDGARRGGQRQQVGQRQGEGPARRHHGSRFCRRRNGAVHGGQQGPRRHNHVKGKGVETAVFGWSCRYGRFALKFEPKHKGCPICSWTWVGFALIWVFHHLSRLPSHFCQILLCQT